jgi:hypothetical protein
MVLMDRNSFTQWFRQMSARLGVSGVSLRFMNANQAKGELGRYEPGEDVIWIDERLLPNDGMVMHTALHEIAHAIVYRRNSEYLQRNEGKIRFDAHNPLAVNALHKLEFKGGHGIEWRQIASGLGVDVNAYVDAPQDASPLGQLRRGIGARYP